MSPGICNIPVSLVPSDLVLRSFINFISYLTLFKVNEVNIDEFEQAIKSQNDKEAERNKECQENQAKNTLQIDNESSDGTKMTSQDTEE